MDAFTPSQPKGFRWWQVVVLALLLTLVFFPWSMVPWIKGLWP